MHASIPLDLLYRMSIKKLSVFAHVRRLLTSNGQPQHFANELVVDIVLTGSRISKIVE